MILTPVSQRNRHEIFYGQSTLTWFLPDIEALRMVDEAYQDRSEWTKKSIRTTAKASRFGHYTLVLLYLPLHADGKIQFRQGYSRLRTGVLEHREREG